MKGSEGVAIQCIALYNKMGRALRTVDIVFHQIVTFMIGFLFEKFQMGQIKLRLCLWCASNVGHAL